MKSKHYWHQNWNNNTDAEDRVKSTETPDRVKKNTKIVNNTFNTDTKDGVNIC